MNPKLLIATSNRKKGGEMLQILGASLPNITLLTLAEIPGLVPVEETGETFEQNARLKAEAGAKLSGLVTIADDGGLVIDALNGAPGVHSHRFLGEASSFEEKMNRILELMCDIPDEKRTCRFQCCAAICDTHGKTITVEGVCEGRIAHEIRGRNGFGYDPIFLLPELHRHMAELTPEEKHKISHRGKALAKAMPILHQIFNSDP